MHEILIELIYPFAFALAFGFFFFKQTLSFLTKAQSFGL